jgi:hypothetical protein
VRVKLALPDAWSATEREPSGECVKHLPPDGRAMS